MTIERTDTFSSDSSRYELDFGACHFKNGFSQIDTEQDAAWFGQWANPATLTVVSYAEGDVTVQRCETSEEFSGLIRGIVEFHGAEFRGIDPMCQKSIQDAFEGLGLGGLLH